MPLRPLQWYRQLADGKGRRASGAFLVEGERAVSQIRQTSPDAIMEIIAVEGRGHDYAGYPLRELSERQFRGISTVRTPQGIMAVVRIPPDTYQARLPENPGDKILLMEDVQDPGNVGTLIRTAAAFGYSGAIMTEKCADPFSPKCAQATAGTVLSIWLRRSARYPDMAHGLQESGYLLVATDLGGSEDISVLEEKKLVLALGNEASGLSPEILGMADRRLRIATTGNRVESLNVAACGAICMYLSCRG